MGNSFQFIFNISGNCTTQLQEIVTETQNVIQQVERATSSLDKMGDNAMRFNAAVDVAHKFVDACDMMVGSSLDFEKQQANLKTLLNGDAEATDRLVSSIREYGKATVYDRSSLVEAQKTMMAFGLDADFAFGKLKNIGDIALGDSDKMRSLALAFSQTTSTGKLMGQDLLQMINAGFNPLEVIAQKTGKSIGVLKEEMSKGAISAEMVAQAFEWATQEGGRFYMGAETAAETTAGKLAKMRDTIDDVKVSLFEATGGATAWIAEIGKMAEPFLMLVPVMAQLAKVPDLFSKIGTQVSKVNLKLRAMIPAQISISAGFRIMANVASAACKKISLAIMKIPIIGWIAAAISLVIGLISLIVKGIQTLWKKCEGFRRLIFGIWEVIKATFNFFAGGLVKAFSGAIDKIRNAFSSLFDWFVGIWENISTWVSDLFGKLAAKFATIGEWIQQHIIHPIKSFFANLWTWVSDILNHIVSKLADVFSPIIELWNQITGKIVTAYKRGAEKGSESFARSKAEQVQDSFGVNDQLQASLSGGGTSDGNSMPATNKSTEAVATGGTRSTHVNIDFRNLVENIIFNGTTSENRQEIERNLAEAMLRVLNMAQSSLG